MSYRLQLTGIFIELVSPLYFTNRESFLSCRVYPYDVYFAFLSALTPVGVIEIGLFSENPLVEYCGFDHFAAGVIAFGYRSEKCAAQCRICQVYFHRSDALHFLGILINPVYYLDEECGFEVLKILLDGLFLDA